MKNTTKTATTANTTNTNESVNWNARYYREKAQAFVQSASYSAPSEPIVMDLTKREFKAQVKAGIEAAQKVRHFRPQLQITQKSFVMVAGVPHKMKDGVLVPMIPAKDSKKWDVLEA
jgi:hypothetical protein